MAVRAGYPQLRSVHFLRHALFEAARRTRMTHKYLDIRVIGVGNPFRSDDGAGIAVVRQLREHAAPGFTLIEESGEGTALLEAWKGAASAIVVDAADSGAPPGAISRFDATTADIPRQLYRCSSHAFSVSEAVHLARVLNQLPPRLVIYAIQGKNFSAGFELTAEVDLAAREVAARILEDVRRFREGDVSCTSSR